MRFRVASRGALWFPDPHAAYEIAFWDRIPAHRDQARRDQMGACGTEHDQGHGRASWLLNHAYLPADRGRGTAGRGHRNTGGGPVQDPHPRRRPGRLHRPQDPRQDRMRRDGRPEITTPAPADRKSELTTLTTARVARPADAAAELRSWGSAVIHLHSLGLPAAAPEFPAAWLRRRGIRADWVTAA